MKKKVRQWDALRQAFQARFIQYCNEIGWREDTGVGISEDEGCMPIFEDSRRLSDDEVFKKLGIGTRNVLMQTVAKITIGPKGRFGIEMVVEGGVVGDPFSQWHYLHWHEIIPHSSNDEELVEEMLFMIEKGITVNRNAMRAIAMWACDPIRAGLYL